MKRSNVKYLILASVAAVGMIAVSMYSCEKENIIPNDQLEKNSSSEEMGAKPQTICGKVIEKQVLDSKGKVVGKATIYNDNDNFHVILTADKGFYFQDAFMHICDEFSQLPVSRDNLPLVESFNFSIKGESASTVRRFELPVDKLKAQSFVSIAAYVTRHQQQEQDGKSQLVWVDGKHFGASGTGNVFIYKKGICLTTQGSTVNE